MSREDDINALLGINPNELVKQERQIKHEIMQVDDKHLGERIISETNDIMDATRDAIGAVLDEVQHMPANAELIESASKLIQSHAGLIDALSKLHLNKEKFQQQVYLTQMKLSTAEKMNTDNNATKVLMSREEIMSRLMEDAKKVDIIDIEV